MASESRLHNFESLQQLILLERFNQSFVDDSELSIWMLSKNPRTLSEAAQLADEFTAMRRANKVKKPNFHQNFCSLITIRRQVAQPEGQNTVLHNAANFKADARNKNGEKLLLGNREKVLLLLLQLNAPTVRNLVIVFNSVSS
jgi:hypothetical protein